MTTITLDGFLERFIIHNKAKSPFFSTSLYLELSLSRELPCIELSASENAHGEYVPSVQLGTVMSGAHSQLANKAEAGWLYCSPKTIHHDLEYE